MCNRESIKFETFRYYLYFNLLKLNGRNSVNIIQELYNLYKKYIIIWIDYEAVYDN